MNNTEKEDSLTLELLAAIDDQSDVTQRHLADRLGVALGLANSYLRRCVRKGLVKIQQAPANRYLYYLTPKGFAEKSRLTATYLSRSFDFYRDASRSIRKAYKKCHESHWNKLLFCGVSELAEIAYIRAQEFDIEITGIYDPDSYDKYFLSLPVWRRFDELPDFDACLVTTLKETAAINYDTLTEKIEVERILIPDILGFSSQQWDELDYRGCIKTNNKKTGIAWMRSMKTECYDGCLTSYGGSVPEIDIIKYDLL